MRDACLRFHFLVPLSRSSLVRYRCRVRFPSTGSYDDHALDRFRLSPAGVGVVFSHAYRLRRADGNGASVEYRLVSRAASALFLLRLANAIARPVIMDIRPVSRIVGRGGRAGRLCLLAAVGAVCPVSSPSSARSFLTLTHRRFARVGAFLCCLALLALPRACRVSLGVAAWSASPIVNPSACGASSFLASPSCPLIDSVSFLMPCCCLFHFSSSFAPSCDTAGGEMSCGGRPWAGPSLVPLLAVRGAVVSCPHGVLLFRVVLVVLVLYVGCVYGAIACRSCGILIL